MDYLIVECQTTNLRTVILHLDFYSYINDRWITDYELTEQQQYIVQIDDFRIVQDKVYRELIQIIEDFIQINFKVFVSGRNACPWHSVRAT